MQLCSAACDTLVFPAPQMWVVSAIRCYIREMKPLVSFLCTAFWFAYFKSVGAHWDRSGNKRIVKFKNIRLSLCSELCVLNELQDYPLKLAKVATLIWFFQEEISARKSDGSFDRQCWEHEWKREVRISLVFLVLVLNKIFTSDKLFSCHSNCHATVPPLFFAF